jgi:hypothetical protein
MAMSWDLGFGLRLSCIVCMSGEHAQRACLRDRMTGGAGMAVTLWEVHCFRCKAKKVYVAAVLAGASSRESGAMLSGSPSR